MLWKPKPQLAFSTTTEDSGLLIRTNFMIFDVNGRRTRKVINMWGWILGGGRLFPEGLLSTLSPERLDISLFRQPSPNWQL